MQPANLPMKVDHCVRRGKWTSPLESVNRSSSCEDVSRLYCCQFSRTVTPWSGLRSLFIVVTVQAGATCCGNGMKAIANTNVAPIRTIVELKLRFIFGFYRTGTRTAWSILENGVI